MNAADENGSRKLRLLLHIGVHKTGSTSIQNRLAANAAALRAQGYLYPLGRFHRWTFQHSELADLIRREPDRLLPLFQGIHAEAVAAGCHTVIISGEAISRLQAPKLALLRDALAVAGFAPTVVVFFRRFFDYVRSVASETMKGNASFITPKSLARRLGIFDETRIVSRFATIFGAGNVVRHDLAPGDDSVALFDRDIGLALPLPTRRANTRIDFATLSWLNAIKAELGIPSSVAQRHYAASFQALPGVLAGEREFLLELAENIGGAAGGLLKAEIESMPRSDGLETTAARLAYLKSLNRFVARLRRHVWWTEMRAKLPFLPGAGPGPGPT